MFILFQGGRFSDEWCHLCHVAKDPGEIQPLPVPMRNAWSLDKMDAEATAFNVWSVKLMKNLEKPRPLFRVTRSKGAPNCLLEPSLSQANGVMLESRTFTQPYIIISIWMALWMAHNHFQLELQLCSRPALQGDCIRIPRAFVSGVHDRCMIWSSILPFSNLLVGFLSLLPRAYPLGRWTESMDPAIDRLMSQRLEVQSTGARALPWSGAVCEVRFVRAPIDAEAFHARIRVWVFF